MKMEKIENINNSEFADYNVGDLLCGYYRDDQKLKESASGGICTALAEMMINQLNGVVFGAAYSNDFSQVEYAIATNVQQLSKKKINLSCLSLNRNQEYMSRMNKIST